MPKNKKYLIAGIVLIIAIIIPITTMRNRIVDLDTSESETIEMTVLIYPYPNIYDIIDLSFTVEVLDKDSLDNGEINIVSEFEGRSNIPFEWNTYDHYLRIKVHESKDYITGNYRWIKQIPQNNTLRIPVFEK